MALTFEACVWNSGWCAVNYTAQGGSNVLSLRKKLRLVTIQVKAIEQYLHVVLLIMLYKVVLILKSRDVTLVCDAVYRVVQEKK